MAPDKYQDLFALDGKVAVVAGGGIGVEICKAMASFGAKVAVYDRDLDEAQRVSRAIVEQGGVASPFRVDVCDPRSIERAVQAIAAMWGQIDICVNNAGVVTRAKAEEMSEEQWGRVLEVNLTGSFHVCQAVGRAMIVGQQGGSIINVASVLGERAVAGRVSYITSKGGVLQLTRALAVEWAKYNINVNCVSPGYVNTSMVAATLQADPVFYEYIISHTPQRRIMRPDDLPGVVIFLASRASAGITGQNICVDGGWSAM